MRYLIVGCGRVGSTLAKLLVADKHDVVVVDENPAAFKRLGNRFGGQVEVGTGIDYDVLKRAGAERADGFVAVTDGDNRNVMAALIAQKMFRIPKIVARIYDPPRGQLYRELGIETFSPTTIGAQIIRDRLQDVWRKLQADWLRAAAAELAYSLVHQPRDFGWTASLGRPLGECPEDPRLFGDLVQHPKSAADG